MDAIELANKYLGERYTLQLATVSEAGPWICTVYFVADDERNLYWASLPSRRHSRDIKVKPSVAAAVVVQNVIGQPVIGIQVEGTAEEMKPRDYNREIVQKYAQKFRRDEQWIEDFMAGKTEHRLYKLTPASMYLFDEVNFPGGQRQVIETSANS
jgi:uncharacterized protein YhbP (UPF0306 family)